MTHSVLVVDDDQSIRDIVVEILGDEGYRVRGFSNGRDALRSLDEEVPDLVVLDMRMPVLNGWEFAQDMRARGHDIPILVMTAAQDARAWAQEIQAVGYIAKPFEVDTMIRAVANALAGSGHNPSTLASLLPQLSRDWRRRTPRIAYRPI